MSDISNDLAVQSTDNNILKRLEELERRVTAIQNSSVKAETLEEISTDMGIIRAGGFVATNTDSLPDESDFTGTFLDATGFTFNEENYHIGGVNTGQLMWGGNSDTGKFIFCNNNAVIDSDGISGTDLLKWLIRQSATAGTAERFGQVGMEELDDKPAWTISYYATSAGTELVTNGDFSGTANWTKTTETNGSWYYPQSLPTGTAEAAVFDTTGTASPHNGVLTSDRFETAAGDSFLCSGYLNYMLYSPISGTSVYAGTANLSIVFWNAGSAGTAVGTTSIYNYTKSGTIVAPDFSTGFPVFETGWIGNSLQITAPSGATHAAIVCTSKGTRSGGARQNVYFDDISVIESTVSNKLQLTDDDLLWNGDSVGQAYIAQGRLTLESGVPVSTTNQANKTTIYYTPFNGDFISLYTNGAWRRYKFTERSLSTAGFTASRMHDMVLYDNAGTLTLEAVAWTNDTTRATALTTQDGVWVLTGATNKRFLGSVYVDASKYCNDSTASRSVNNYYNKAPRLLVAQMTGNWNYTTATVRPANNNTTLGQGRFVYAKGFDDGIGVVILLHIASLNGNGVTRYCGIGIDSTNTTSSRGYMGSAASTTGHTSLIVTDIGYHYVQQLEHSIASGTTTWYSGSSGAMYGVIYG